MAQLKSMTLIFISLLVLSIPGILYNNLNNNGLVVAQTQALSCSSDAQEPICQISGSVGCQAASSNCQLSGSSISFLNSKSPFTGLISGNLFGLFTNLNPLTSSGAAQTSWSGTHGPFDITGNPQYYTADCYGNSGSAALSQTAFTVGKCTQTYTDNANVSEANTVTFNNWNTQWNTTLALQFYRLGNATFPKTCVWLAQINYTSLANGPGYTYFGCVINQESNASIQVPPSPPNPTHRSWSYLVAMPVTDGALTAPAGTNHHYHLFVQLENWMAEGCINNLNMGAYRSIQCTNFLQGFKGVSLGCQAASCASFVPNSGGAIIFGFLAGIILLILGLGMSVGIGGGVSAGTNEQGSRIAQALGLGLVVWTFLYSQFSTWFTSGILPYGMDGSLGLVSVVISGLFFAGVFWRTLSLD